MSNVIKIDKNIVNPPPQTLFEDLYKFDRYGEYFEDLSCDIETSIKLLIKFYKKNDDNFMEKFLTFVCHDADFGESFFEDAIFRIFLKKENIEKELKDFLEEFTDGLREDYENYLSNFKMEKN